jgi:hypothetical protein
MFIEEYPKPLLYCMLAVRGTEAGRRRLISSMQLLSHQSGSKSFRSALIVAHCLFLVVLASAPNTFPQSNNDNNSGQQRLLALINQERAKEGLPPLRLDERLSRAALKHTQLMVDNDSLSHQFEGEEPLQLRVSDQHVRCDHDGENVALDSDLGVAHVMLMQSPPHRANILNPQFNAVGIGIVKVDELIYITEDFAHVLPSYSELEADSVAQQAVTEYEKSLGVAPAVRRPSPQLRQVACDMALDDSLESKKLSKFPGLTSGIAWTAADLGKLPPNLKRLLAQPLTLGYSLGVCFAPSVSHPGGIYWLVMVIY